MIVAWKNNNKNGMFKEPYLAHEAHTAEAWWEIVYSLQKRLRNLHC